MWAPFHPALRYLYHRSTGLCPSSYRPEWLSLTPLPTDIRKHPHGSENRSAFFCIPGFCDGMTLICSFCQSWFNPNTGNSIHKLTTTNSLSEAFMIFWNQTNQERYHHNFFHFLHLKTFLAEYLRPQEFIIMSEYSVRRVRRKESFRGAFRKWWRSTY